MRSFVYPCCCLIAAACLALPASANLIVTGNWTASGNTYPSPPIDNLPAFRDYFAAVLKGYDFYEARADELAAGIIAVGPMTPRTTDTGEFGELGQNVQFNPLATGGTQDIATGGNYIDKQANGEKKLFEVAHVDIETNVFRQDFGPVQTNQRVIPPPPDPNGPLEGDWFEFRFLPDGPPLPAPTAAIFADNPTVRLAVVPEPAAAAALIGLAGLAMRRRLAR